MPLLRRQPFVKQKPPPDLLPDEEVFYCNLTGEIFRDYDQFFERIILCNSLVWSCSLTGRSGLTFLEAHGAEDKARKQLASFPDTLQKPILFLVSLTHRTRLNVLIDDIFAFCKDRYFLSEAVDVTVRDERRPGKVICVNVPANSPQKAVPPIFQNGGSPDKPVTIEDSDDEVICLGTEPPKEASPPESAGKMADASKYTYTIQERGKLNSHTVGPLFIHRKKGLFNRDKLKLYLKLHCETSPEGVWTVKERFINKFNLNSLPFSTIYSGPLPTFTKSEISKKGLKSKKMTSAAMDKVAKKLKKAEKVQKGNEKLPAAAEALKNPKLTPAERAELKQRLKEVERVQKEARKEELKGRIQEEKARIKEEREKEREKLKKEKRQREEELKEWSRPREDLECEDLKPLPVPKMVQISVPTALFGDIVMVLEYLHCFNEIFNMQEEFPDGLTVVSLARFLAETDVNGGYFDLLKFLLTAVFNLQAEEMEEEEMEEEGQAAATINDLIEEAGTFSSEALVRAATIASQWPQLNYGSPLNKLQLDPFTLTEVLRLHLLSSGAKVSDRNCKYQYQQRGGYTSMDDAGLELRRSEPRIIKALSNHNLFDMPPGDKLRLLVALVNQLLTYVVSRDTLDENYENMRQIKADLRQLQYAEIRREKDEAQYWYKKRMEERAKEREEEEKKKAEKKKQREDKLKLEELAVKAKAEGLNLRDLATAENVDYLLDKEKEEPEKEEPKREVRSVKVAEEKPERISARQKLAKQKEDYDKEIPTENIDWEKVTVAEREEWRQRHVAKEAELLDKIHELQHGNAIYPMGRDRTFRRYWVFRSLPGLFIEDHDEYVDNDFFTPVEQTGSHAPFVSENLPLSNNAKQSDVTEKSTCSDKENDQKLGNGADTANTAKPLGDLNKTVEGMDVDIKKLLLTETVHDQIARRNTVRWSYIDNSEQFDRLVDSLNPRGHREGPLRLALMEQKDLILSSIEKCPRHELQPTDDTLLAKSGVKVQNIKSRNRVTQGSVNNASANEFLELNLREMLLDLEERIYAGALGAVKVNDRTKWRDGIEKGEFDLQTDTLMWSGKPEEHIKTEMEKLEEDSDDESDKGADENIASAVYDLRRALLQTEQGIDKKYLNPPLGEDENTKRARQKAAVEAAFKGLQGGGKKNKESKDNKDSDSSSESEIEEENEAMKKTPLERWEESLMSSTSLPQLFLHISVLERSIVWSKSALHARCRICRRKGDAEHMLLCDGCDRGHHMYCLKPVVKNVPRGDWYCVDCRPKVIVQTPRKARRSMSAPTEESEPEVEEEESGSEEEEADSDDAEELVDSNDEVAESDDDVAEDDDSEDDSDVDDDSDDSGSDEDDEDEDDDDDDDSEESEEEVVKPAAVKLIKAGGRSRPASAPSSGRSTPSLAPGRRSNDPTPAESGRASRGRSSLETSGPATKRSRPNVSAKRTSTGTSKSTGKKTTSEPRKAATKKILEKGKHSRSNSAQQRGSAPVSKATKRKLEMEDSDKPTAKKVATKSRGGEMSHLKQSEMLLLELASNEDAWPFARPVTKREAPDYHTIIKTPMDFQTMKAKMNKFEYMEASAILEDLRLIFENCERYNVPDAKEYLAGQRLCSYFVKRVKELGLKAVLTAEAAASPPKQNGTGRGKGATKSSLKVNGGTSKTGGRRKSGRRT